MTEPMIDLRPALRERIRELQSALPLASPSDAKGLRESIEVVRGFLAKADRLAGVSGAPRR